MLPFPQHIRYVGDRVIISTPEGYLFTSDVTVSDLNQLSCIGDIDAKLATKVNKSGDTMSGNLNMGSQNITNAGLITSTSFIAVGGLNTDFLKADGSIDSDTTTILSDLDYSVSNLLYTTQNMSATLTTTTFTKSILHKLSNTENFTITDNVLPLSTTKFNISNLLITAGVPLNMGSNKIQHLATCTVGTDGANKNYVDSLVNPINTRVTTLETKTQKITDGPSGITIAGDITSDAFIKTGGTNQQYLMADGTILQYSANSGNSNFYLYNSSESGDINPLAGQITYNNPLQGLATMIYISHVTRDNIDIEVYFKQITTLNEVYIQDQNLSEKFIQYDITAAPTITTANKIAIPVLMRTSSGSGSTTFGANHNVLLSFFTNSIEVDQRISLLETKTQNQSAIPLTTTFNGSLLLTLDLTGDMEIKNDLSTVLLNISNAGINVYTHVISSGDITATKFIKSGGLATQFLLADGSTANTSSYATSTNLTNGLALKLNLTGGTLSGSLNIAGNVNPRLGPFDVFNITAADGVTDRFRISNTNAISFITMSMGNNILNGIPTPVSTDDAVNKAYADTKVPKIGDSTITGNLTASSFIKSGGTATQFLLADGSTANTSSYATSTNLTNGLALKLNLTGGTMSGPINMGAQNITNCGTIGGGDITATKFIKSGGLATEFLLADGSTTTASAIGNIQAVGVTAAQSVGLTELIMNAVVTVGSYSFLDRQIGTVREWVFHGTQNRASAMTSIYTLRHKTNGTTNMSSVLPATTATTASNLPFVLRFRVVRYTSAAISWSGAWSDIERNWNFYTTQNASGGVVALNTLAAYTITFQSNRASSTINIHHVDVFNLYS